MNTATAELARLEARRMLRHPAPWAGLVLSALAAWNIWDESWSGQRYTGLVAAAMPLLLGVSLASVSAFGRELVPVADAAPLDRSQRSVARLVAGLPHVLLVLVVVAGVAVWLRAIDGVPLGDYPRRTEHAHHSMPELLQVVLLGAVAVVLGAVAVRLLRQRLAAGIVLTVVWFLMGTTYWIFQGPVVRWLAVVQVQPVWLNVGPPETDPHTFPRDWLVTTPGQYQDHWARVVVSPLMAVWHDAYLVGLLLLLVAVLLSGRARTALIASGLVVAVAAVGLQHAARPQDDGVRIAAAADGFAAPALHAEDATPVVVDTDLAGDDLVALAYLLRRPDVRVVAVTVAGTGLVGCDPGVDLVADLVHALRERPVPVACGREDPARQWPAAWRATAARAPGLPRVDTTLHAEPEPAPELIAKLAASTRDLHVVALGPLTNLADLADQRPEDYRRLSEIYSMAGAVDVPSVAGVAEWNAAADPAALAAVLAGPVPVTLVPDDAIPKGTPEALLAPVIGGIAASNAIPKWWDTSTAAAFTEPALVATSERGGWTVDDTGRLHRGGPGSVTVVTHLDPAARDAALRDTFSG